jgi:hypothetical protein
MEIKQDYGNHWLKVHILGHGSLLTNSFFEKELTTHLDVLISMAWAKANPHCVWFFFLNGFSHLFPKKKRKKRENRSTLESSSTNHE